MPNYGVSDVIGLMRERDWQSWDELLGWLEEQKGHEEADRGTSERDRAELVRDLTRLRDEGHPLPKEAGELYRAAVGVAPH